MADEKPINKVTITHAVLNESLTITVESNDKKTPSLMKDCENLHNRLMNKTIIKKGHGKEIA